MTRTLHRKLRRDLRALRGPVIAIVLIIACGVAGFLTVLTAYSGLKSSRDAYYRDYRMADLFAPVKRAPRAVERELEAIEGVKRASGRIVFDVNLDLADEELPCSGRAISVPDRRRPILNDLHLVQGRWFEGEGTGEVILADRFARLHRLGVGDRIAVVMNDRKQSLRIVATAISPEFVYLIRGGTEILPDARHFTVLWLSRTFAEAVFDCKEACTAFTALLEPGAPLQDVIDAFDRKLDRYGATGAYSRADQLSNRSLGEEIKGLKGTATMVPVIFLGVAAYVLNMLMRRLVSTQRAQIAVLRAFGYTTVDLALHYLELALLVGAAGALLGCVVGLWFARGLAGLYQAFFSFPELAFRADPFLIASAFGISLFFAALGALGAVRRVVRLEPAEGLRPEAPPIFRRTWTEALGPLWRGIGFRWRMILRNVARNRTRTAATIAGVALSASILVLAFFGNDSMQGLIDHQFRLVEREDIRIAFHRERGPGALLALRHLDGVRRAEGLFTLPVKLVKGWRSRRTAITGLGTGDQLHALLDSRLRHVPLPARGLLLSSKLAELLHVRVGELLEARVLTGKKPHLKVHVARIVEEYIGTAAYADRGWLSRIMGGEEIANGALLRVDANAEQRLGAALKRLPAVASVSVKARTLESFRKTIAASQGIMTTVLILFAGVITFGVLFNAARIALSERQRELGSMRVLGFTRREVAAVLLGENLFLATLALLPGLALGALFAWLLTRLYDTDLYRFPFTLRPASMLYTAAVVLCFTLLANLLVRRRLRRLDLVEVLKAGE